MKEHSDETTLARLMQLRKAVKRLERKARSRKLGFLYSGNTSAAGFWRMEETARKVQRMAIDREIARG